MFKPKCLNNPPCSASYCVDGFVLPCCYVDYNDLLGYNILNEDLHITNIENIRDDVFLSDEWLDFFDMLENRPEEAPDRCKQFCTDNETHKIMIR